jgi:hypothetical protein
MKTMNRIVLGVCLLGAGCLSLPAEKPESPQPPLRAAAEAPPPPSILPEQVNEHNARAMADALAQELDHATRERSAKAPAAGGE